MWRNNKFLILTAILTLAVSLLSPLIANAQPNTQQPPATQAPPVNPEDDGTTCSIEKIGWILCPVIEGAAKIGDAAFSVLANNFLQIEPALVNDDANGTKGAWEISRNIANIMFIIAFMVIIYSQITGAGLSNYGIKRMLPRIVFAAILVNISYYICQGLVDITNAGGFLIKEALYDIAGQVNNRAAMGSGESTAGVLAAITVAILAAGAIVFALLPILLPIVMMVLITAIVIIIILLLRKAIVVLLVVISPIAFVAYLLPNTEKLFSKWLHMFWQLLLVFPVVALLFGSGQLASSVILAAGQNSSSKDSTYTTEGEECVTLPSIGSGEAAVTGECGTGTTTLTLGLIAAGISVAPLLAVWAVLQGALAAAGAVGGKMAGVIQKAGDGRRKGFQEDLAKRRERISNDRQASALNNKWSGANIATLGGTRRAVRRNARSKKAKTGLEAAEAGFNLTDEKASQYTQQAAVNQAAISAANIANNSNLRNSIATGTGVADSLGEKASQDPEIAKAISAQISKATSEAIKDVELSASFEPGDIKSIAQAFESSVAKGDSVSARAYQNMLLKSGGPGLKEYRNSMSNLTSPGTMDASGNSVFGSTMTDVRRNMMENNSGVKGAAKDLMDQATSGKSMSEVSNQASTWHMSDAELVGQKPDSIKIALGVPGAISRDQAKRIIDTPTLSQHVNEDVLSNLRIRAR